MSMSTSVHTGVRSPWAACVPGTGGASGYDRAMRDAFDASDPRMRRAAVEAVRLVTGLEPEVAIVLGSGLGPLADEIDEAVTIPYTEIPGFAASTAPGHAGQLVLGRLAGRSVVAMQGRVHPYDGFPAAQAAFPMRVMHALGASATIVSNACGGLNPAFAAGDVMLQLDFVNHTFMNPLVGPNDDDVGPRFPVMFDAYDRDYLNVARREARRLDMTLREGVYLAVSGPNYATRAELRAYRAWGADAIGMSTVFEVMVARHEGMRVLGLSTVTDMALPDLDHHADHAEVLRVASASGERFRALVRAVLPHL